MRYQPDGTGGEILDSDGLFSSMAFGRGALACNDLSLVNVAGSMRRITVETPGKPVP